MARTTRTKRYAGQLVARLPAWQIAWLRLHAAQRALSAAGLLRLIIDDFVRRTDGELPPGAD